MTQFSSLVQPQIKAIQPYVPGKPVSALQREMAISSVTKLASNENPLGCSVAVQEAVQSQLSELSRYPDGSAFELKQAIAHFLDSQTVAHIQSNQIAVGNGSNEVLELIARTYAGAGDEIVYSQYAFAVYPLVAQVVGAKGVAVEASQWGHDLDAMLKAITNKTKIIFIANPNNPTGTFFNKHLWQKFIAQVPKNILVVLDEAYFEYAQAMSPAEHFFSGLDDLNQYSNLIVTRSFSKVYGLGALRVGYVVGHADMVAYLDRIREPFNVNQLAQVSAIAALQDQEFVAQSVKVNQLGLKQMTTACEALQIAVIPSMGNFLCLEIGDNALEVNQALLQKGIIVRPLSGYGMHRHLRVSIGTSVENDRFIDALKVIMRNHQETS